MLALAFSTPWLRDPCHADELPRFDLLGPTNEGWGTPPFAEMIPTVGTPLLFEPSLGPADFQLMCVTTAGLPRCGDPNCRCGAECCCRTPGECQMRAAPKPVVFYYGLPPAQCAPCGRFLAERDGLPFEFKARPAPAWVEEYPTFHWKVSNGEWRKFSGWYGQEAFRKAFNDAETATSRAHANGVTNRSD